MAEDTKKMENILKEDKNTTVDSSEISRIFRIYLNREATPEEVARFEGIKESEMSVISDYISIETGNNSLETEKTVNKEKSIMDAMKIEDDLSNKEMKVRGGNNIDALKNMAAMPGMAGQMNAMPSVVPKPMIDMGAGGGPGPAQKPNQKYLKDGRFILVKFKD